MELALAHDRDPVMKWMLTFGAVALAFALPARVSAQQSSTQVLHLDEALRIARTRQPTILQARAETEGARGRVEQARADFFPKITGTALYQRVHSGGAIRPVTTTAPTTGTGTSTVSATGSGAATYDLFSFGLTGTQLLWDFGQTWQRTRAAGASRDAQLAAERTARLQAELLVRRAFFQAQAQKALVSVGEETVANQRRHLAQIRGFVEQGIRPDIDLAQARADLSSTELSLINARTGYLTARAQLNQAMGVARPIDYEIASEELTPVPGEDQPLEPLVKIALRDRPELSTLARQVRAAELSLSAVKGAYGPTLNAQGSVSRSGLAIDELNTNWSVGLNLTWPIFQGGLTHGQAREARANIDVARAQALDQALTVRVEVAQALLNVQAAKAAIATATEGLTNARERLRLAEGRYESGVGSILELDDAQLAFASAGSQRVQADYNLATARADLLRALGR